MEQLNKIKELRKLAKIKKEKAQELEDEAFEKMERLLEQAMRKKEDKLLNRTQAIELLWFTTHQALKDWENKVADLGYLNFQDNKILRSEVLRFRDDYQSGKLAKEMRKAGRR